MKAIAVAAVVIGVVLFALYAIAWVVLVAQNGAAEAIRLGLTIWPGNVVGFALLGLSILFGVGGLMLLDERNRP